MSGHSKWATTKRQKETTDAKRSGLFTKLSKNIAVAARDGVDPNTNFKLRIAMDQAKVASMPKDNIERAIARGSGNIPGRQLERALYEGYGPGGTALIVEVVTDNKKRTISEVKHYFSKHKGNLAGSGSVAWMFDLRGIISIQEKKLTETQELSLIDSGLVDMQKGTSGTILITDPDELKNVKDAAEALELSITEASLGYVAKEQIDPKEKDNLISFLDGLDELDDVDTIYTNANI